MSRKAEILAQVVLIHGMKAADALRDAWQGENDLFAERLGLAALDPRFVEEKQRIRNARFAQNRGHGKAAK